jgi:hypothetical protein
VPLGLGNAATDAVIAHSGQAVPAKPLHILTSLLLHILLISDLHVDEKIILRLILKKQGV